MFNLEIKEFPSTSLFINSLSGLEEELSNMGNHDAKRCFGTICHLNHRNYIRSLRNFVKKRLQIHRCWINLGSSVAMATIIPIMALSAAIVVMVEASGMGKFSPLPGHNEAQAAAAMYANVVCCYISTVKSHNVYGTCMRKYFATHFLELNHYFYPSNVRKKIYCGD